MQRYFTDPSASVIYIRNYFSSTEIIVLLKYASIHMLVTDLNSLFTLLLLSMSLSRTSSAKKLLKVKPFEHLIPYLISSHVAVGTVLLYIIAFYIYFVLHAFFFPETVRHCQHGHRHPDIQPNFHIRGAGFLCFGSCLECPCDWFPAKSFQKSIGDSA